MNFGVNLAIRPSPLVPLRLLGKTKDNCSIVTPCQERHLLL